ncbi:MAG: DUF2975 domain-containing protein [Clostridia bacterium]|nr:DUF2975 domain-containing protein [Clostridia bacterium]
MLKINRKISVTISLVLTALALCGVVAMAFFIPSLIEYMLEILGSGGAKLELLPAERITVYVAAYAELALAAAGLGMLFALLLLVRKGRVFTHTAVELIRYISWCIIFMGFIIIAVTFSKVLAMAVGAAVLFVGLTIRVVKNVIEEAVYIKEENDLTV